MNWSQRVLLAHPFCVCGARAEEAHHVIPKSFLRRELTSKTQPRVPVEVMNDPRNGMGLCRQCHSRHTNHFKRLSLNDVPHEAWMFAQEHGVEWRLHIDYEEIAA
jgi:5-methylcytosine-specific restriction endonuclease McrA